MERLLHEDFTEFGASGARWDRAAMLASLAAEPAQPAEVSGLVARSLAEDVVLVTYVAEHEGAVTLRSSIWVKSDPGWQVLFHQGTPAS